MSYMDFMQMAIVQNLDTGVQNLDRLRFEAFRNPAGFRSAQTYFGRV